MKNNSAYLENINYLYQASLFLSKVALSKVNQNTVTINFASNYYIHTLINTAKKSVLRIDVDVKRKICKKCRNILILGKTAHVRTRKKPSQQVKWTCLICKKKRTYNLNNDYALWIDHPNSVNVEKQN